MANDEPQLAPAAITRQHIESSLAEMCAGDAGERAPLPLAGKRRVYGRDLR
jgi:hypothetical protein